MLQFVCDRYAVGVPSLTGTPMGGQPQCVARHVATVGGLFVDGVHLPLSATGGARRELQLKTSCCTLRKTVINTHAT